jgi:hypothetical protein
MFVDVLGGPVPEGGGVEADCPQPPRASGRTTITNHRLARVELVTSPASDDSSMFGSLSYLTCCTAGGFQVPSATCFLGP